MKISRFYPVGEGSAISVDREGVTRIEEREENGQMAPVLVLHVFRGDELWIRVSSHLVQIEYETPEYDKRDAPF